MKNTLNTIKSNSDKIKSKIKNLTASLTILGILGGTACTNNEKNHKENESTKTEQTIDSFKNTQIDSIQAIEKEQINIDELEILDLEAAAETAMQELEEENQPERKRLNFEDEKAYKACLKAQKTSLQALQLTLEGNEAFRAESEVRESIENSLQNCKMIHNDLEQPLPEIYYKVKKLLENAKAKAKK